MDASSKPARIGGYDVVDVIGRGGMGTVFRANDPRIGRSVAIKMLSGASDDPDQLVRFRREAKYMGNLHHPNIVTIYELGEENGVPYLVMEYLEGVSLEASIGSGRPMPMADKLGIILQVCNGLTYAHQSGLVHRDIKPANIVIVKDGTAKIVDFGIALLGASQLTRTGHIVGSLSYMSPEQLSGEDLDARSDVYSTGVVLFQLLTGKLPFEGASTAATLKQILQDPPPRLTDYLRDCPPELEAILNKALAKNRNDRYSAADEFAVDLSRVHEQYQRNQLVENLQRAADCLRHKDYASARQLVMQVLRAAPQNTEASELHRRIKQAQEQQEREQQVLQLQMKAEEAIRKNQVHEAMQLIEQGSRLDPNGTVFSGLRAAIQDAQSRTVRYRESLKRAEAALKSGDLQTAKRSVLEAQEILPEDPAARTLANHIIARLDQHLREQKPLDPQRQLPLSRPESFALPKENFSAQPPAESFADESLSAETEEVPVPHFQPQTDVSEWRANHESNQDLNQNFEPEADWPQESFAPPSHQQTPPDAPYVPHDVLYPRTKPSPRDKQPEVAPELREFLEPVPSGISRSTIWLAIAVCLIVGVFVWIISRPSPKPPTQVTAASLINAEPWATVAAITPVAADVPRIIGQATPVWVKLPPGNYNVTLRGPNHEEQKLDLNVSQLGGASCFAIFEKPDLKQLVEK